MIRFEFDNEGYVSCILYGCTTGSCVEYTGLVPAEPEEYTDMDDWANRAQTQAYYLNEQGNLTYDPEKAASLPAEDVITPYSPEQIRAMGIFDAIYPVGSLYMSVNDVNPEILFGGTWERIEDRFILASGSEYESGSEGGAASYELTGKHKHIAPVGSTSSVLGLVSVNGTTTGGNGKAYQTVNVDHTGTLNQNITLGYTSNASIDETIPTLPPYLAVFVWKRTA